MTGYHIDIGYNACNPDPEEDWSRLKEIVAELRSDPARIVAETRRLPIPECGHPECDVTPEVLAEYYRPGSGDLALSIIEVESGDEDNRPQIMQLAGGGCSVKHAVRRAFCRLVIEAAHREGIEVNLHVC